MKSHFLSGLLLAVVLASMPSFSSCDNGEAERQADVTREREYFEAMRRQRLPADLEYARARANFEVVLPGYLPAGFELDRVATLFVDHPVPESASSGVSVWLTFMNRPARAVIQVVEAGPSGVTPILADVNYASAEIKGVRVAIAEGTVYTAIDDGTRGGASSTVVAEMESAAHAFWTHRGVSFAMLTTGASRDEAEKVIASMIE
ncbi:MAG: hypothetical protein HY673_12400 [Chloroflexi bacterium]|nr:hypothetical protein [Chloroflexota bacterium]